jgi:hypothetical protein
MPHEAAENLLALLREIVEPGHDVDVAVHPELRRVLVFSGDDVVLSCSFDDLIAGPGVHPN